METAKVRSLLPSTVACGAAPKTEGAHVDHRLELVGHLVDLVAGRNAYVTAESQRTTAATTALFRFGVDDAVALFSQLGWRVTAIKPPGDEDCDFGRLLGPPAAAAGFSFLFCVH